MLDPQALLNALVERAREALQVDTAAILLLDRRSGQPVAAAASGLEDRLSGGYKYRWAGVSPGGSPAQGRPVVLNEVDHTKVINPILLDKGIRSLMGAPLLAEGKVIGVLHVGTLSPRAFTSDDVDLLQLAADRAAVAVQALTAQGDRAATSVLQRSLVPSALPVVGGLEMAARYVPGTGNVGGDWYASSPSPPVRCAPSSAMWPDRPAGGGDHGPYPQRDAGIRAANSRPRRTARPAGP